GHTCSPGEQRPAARHTKGMAPATPRAWRPPYTQQQHVAPATCACSASNEALMPKE
ncbi:hypothetical protein A2U01_0079811, partial [Trifolium medium]|nr:hypothetical protein [Trifolium medium]